MNLAKQKLAAGKLVLCMGLRQARSPDIAMIAAECGFDALYADMEHSPMSLETVSAICVGARFIIAGNDTNYLAAAARKDVEALRALA